MGNRTAVGTLLCGTFDVDMYPLMVTGSIGELVHPVLGDLEPLAVTEVSTDSGLHLVDTIEHCLSHSWIMARRKTHALTGALNQSLATLHVRSRYVTKPIRPALLRGVVVVVTSISLAITTVGCTRPSSRPTLEESAEAATPTTEIDVPDPLPDPGVEPGECETIVYTPPDAPEEHEGELCRPEDHQRDVAVMVVHGGSGIGGSHEGMRPWANELLAQGYAVFMPGYHLFTPDSNESPVFPRPEQDIKAAVQYLRGTARAVGISRDRIVVQGMSAGARIGAVAFTTPEDPFFDGPSLWPEISDRVNGFIGYYHPYDGSMQFAYQYYGGPDDSDDPDVITNWAKADALANAHKAQGPALLITGSADWDIQIDQQEDLASRLEAIDLEATTLVVKGGGHGFDQSGSKLTRLGHQALEAQLQWLNNRFPQDPRREARAGDDDDSGSAPNYTGLPPTTYPMRRWHTPSPYDSGYTRSTNPDTDDADSGDVSTTTSTTSSGSSSSGSSSSTTSTPSTSTPSTTSPSVPPTTTTTAPPQEATPSP